MVQCFWFDFLGQLHAKHYFLRLFPFRGLWRLWLSSGRSQDRLGRALGGFCELRGVFFIRGGERKTLRARCAYGKLVILKMESMFSDNTSTYDKIHHDPSVRPQTG